MGSIRAVVFDLDGLMFNTEDIYPLALDRTCQGRGARYGAELREQMMGRPGKTALQILIDALGWDATVEAIQSETDAHLRELLPLHLQTMPGLLELLAAIEQQNLPKAIGTSSRRWFVESVLAPFSLADRFHSILTAEDVTHGKPDPEIYLKAADRLGVAPHEMAVLEDSTNGCRAALAAGAVAIAVPNDHTRAFVFPEVHLMVDSLADPRLYAKLGLPTSSRLSSGAI
jgi:HAD superfamily hydrolase (TIGR01509 family)